MLQSFSKGRKDQEERDHKEVAVKMTTAYFLAKEELSFSKFQALINLQIKNGLDMTSTYANDKLALRWRLSWKEVKKKTTNEINLKNYRWYIRSQQRDVFPGHRIVALTIVRATI